jgi:uncharacterized protein YkwD
MLGCLLILPGCLTVMSAPDPAPVSASRLERETIDAVNDARARAGLARLAPVAVLSRIAREQSVHQAEIGRLSHEGAGGTSLADRVQSAGVRYRTIAENVALNQGHPDPVETAVRGWMDSSGHRQNILNPAFTETGVGIVEGREGAIFFTQLFLAPPAVP